MADHDASAKRHAAARNSTDHADVQDEVAADRGGPASAARRVAGGRGRGRPAPRRTSRRAGRGRRRRPVGRSRAPTVVAPRCARRCDGGADQPSTGPRSWSSTSWSTSSPVPSSSARAAWRSSTVVARAAAATALAAGAAARPGGGRSRRRRPIGPASAPFVVIGDVEPPTSAEALGDAVEEDVVVDRPVAVAVGAVAVERLGRARRPRCRARWLNGREPGRSARRRATGGLDARRARRRPVAGGLDGRADAVGRRATRPASTSERSRRPMARWLASRRSASSPTAAPSPTRAMRRHCAGSIFTVPPGRSGRG